MKRFYSQASVAAVAPHWEIQLDGKSVRTPQGTSLLLATPSLAAAIADEWNAQGERIDMAAMPLLHLAYGSQGMSGPDRAARVKTLAAYAETELLCHRAEHGPLAESQHREWEPLLVWAEQHYGVSFARAKGIMPLAQPPATLAAIHAEIERRPPTELVALDRLTHSFGSIVLALAVVERKLGAGTALELSLLESRHQASFWGTDPATEAIRVQLERNVATAERFLLLSNT